MVLRRKPAGRSHVARLAAASLISLSLVGLSGAANADILGDQHALCLQNPLQKLTSPGDIAACAKKKAQPSAEPSARPSAQPSEHKSIHLPSHVVAKPKAQAKPQSHLARKAAKPQADPGNPPPPVCVPLPRDVSDLLPLSLGDCLPPCPSAAEMRTLQSLSADQQAELADHSRQTLADPGSNCPSPPTSPPPTSPPPSTSPTPGPTQPTQPGQPSQPSQPSQPGQPSTGPTNSANPGTANPATPIDGNPDFTG